MKVKISLVVVFATLVAATWAFGDGFNLVSWPLIPHDNSTQAVFADSMGNGCQVAGGYPAANSDQVKYFDASTSTWFTAWYKVGGPGPSNQWKGMATIDADLGYWIIIKSAHPAVTLTMTGSVNTAARSITVAPGLSFNFVGTAFAEARPLQGAGDDCGLLASGFTGGFPAAVSDNFRYFDGTTWYTAWYKIGGPGPGNVFRGTLSSGDAANTPNFRPGNGYILQVQAGHTFVANTWTYIANPAKGAKTDLEQQTRTARRQVELKRDRFSNAPSTAQKLGRESAVEQKKSR